MPDSERTTGPSPAPPAGEASGKWNDLGTRITSAIVLIVIAGAALWIGGYAWRLLIAVVVTLMGWELARLCEPGIRPTRSFPLAASFIVSPLVLLPLFAATVLSGQESLAMHTIIFVGFGGLLLPQLLGFVLLAEGRWIWIAYSLVIQCGAIFFLLTGGNSENWKTLFLVVGIVITSDTLGYFMGRLIGGPKFWPRISPKKTWSGTVAGWIGAAGFAVLVTGWLAPDLGGDISLLRVVVLAVLVAFAGQMGDIAASAIKRRVDVKDASNLIPGHGGFMDRLDALIAAAAVAGAIPLIESAVWSVKLATTN